MGSVVLELSKDGERFHITHYPFYLNSSAFYGYNEFINGSFFYLNYNPDRCSFYFEDLDFDGEEELIFSHYHEGQRMHEEGKAEGKLASKKEDTLMLFKSKFPQEDNELLENLTLQQYDHIFKALIENKYLKTIKKIIGK